MAGVPRLSFLISYVLEQGDFDGDYVYCKGFQKVGDDPNKNIVVIFRRESMLQGMMLLDTSKGKMFTMAPDQYIHQCPDPFIQKHKWEEIPQDAARLAITTWFGKDDQHILLVLSGEVNGISARINGYPQDDADDFANFCKQLRL